MTLKLLYGEKEKEMTKKRKEIFLMGNRKIKIHKDEMIIMNDIFSSIYMSFNFSNFLRNCEKSNPEAKKKM